MSLGRKGIKESSLSIVVERVINGRLFEYCYFAYSNDSKDAICIDPGYDTNRILDFIKNKNLNVTDILLTHGHFDHMLSCKILKDYFNSNVYISDVDEKILYDSEHNYASLINKTSFDKFNVTNHLIDGDVITLNSYSIKCISTPGHTKGSFCFYLEDENILFSGDTLFYETYGRCDLYTGNFNEIKKSIIEKLFILPDNTIVYPGHGNTTSIGEEKLHNEILL